MELIGKQIAIETILGQPPELHYPSWYAAQIEKLPPANCSEFPNNSDTISRQAAIAALKGCYCGGEDSCGEPWIYENQAVKAIEQLPTIQPEIIRCKDCKYARLTNDGSCKYCDIWFPDEAEYMDGDYYCASAERKSNG